MEKRVSLFSSSLLTPKIPSDVCHHSGSVGPRELSVLLSLPVSLSTSTVTVAQAGPCSPSLCSLLIEAEPAQGYSALVCVGVFAGLCNSSLSLVSKLFIIPTSSLHLRQSCLWFLAAELPGSKNPLCIQMDLLPPEFFCVSGFYESAFCLPGPSIPLCSFYDPL